MNGMEVLSAHTHEHSTIQVCIALIYSQPLMLQQLDIKKHLS